MQAERVISFDEISSNERYIHMNINTCEVIKDLYNQRITMEKVIKIILTLILTLLISAWVVAGIYLLAFIIYAFLF